MSKSEYGEDQWIEAHVHMPHGGFYVDLGCAWPHINSNTAFLRRRGWRGLAVDGNPAYAHDWVGVEKFVHAVIGDGGEVLFELNPNPDLSRVGSGQAIQTVRLDSLLEGIERIDFLSVDLEGQEFAALQTLDWSKHQPPVIIAEYNTHGIGEDFRVRDMLIEKGYRAAHQTIANLVYLL